MPARNRIKRYLENGYYHIYNRGVEKRRIFLDRQDYGVFLSYLKEYLLPKNQEELMTKLANPIISPKEKSKILQFLRLNNFYGEITLLAYCLMPNHFHFFLKQKGANTIDKFMNSLCTRYTMYFNRKYNRVGSLYQSVYKAVLVTDENQFIYLSKYIHKQALKGQALKGVARDGQPNSYSEYLGIRKSEWIRPEEVLNYFSSNNPTLSYKSFIEKSEDFDIIQDVLIEE